MPTLHPPLFVYGTLRDPEIRNGVVGRSLPARDLRPARARGWRTVYFPGEVYPALVPAGSASTAAGLIVFGLTVLERKRLDAFEGDQYRVGTLRVESAKGTLDALAYFPAVDIGADAQPWDFERWTFRHRPGAIQSYRINDFAPDRPGDKHV